MSAEIRDICAAAVAPGVTTGEIDALVVDYCEKHHVKALPPKVEGICDKCGAALTVRKDDNPETVRDRLVVYHRETEPLVAYYEAKGLLRRIDGDQGPVRNAAAFKAAM